MSENTNFGFGRFVPGFDFLQTIAKGATQNMAQLPAASSWIAPTLNVEELEKRIAEMKAVQFWLEQNGKALAATIQALEVQRMTLATLQGMNVQMADLADALKVNTTDGMQKMAEAASAAGAAAKAPRAKAGAEARAGGGDAKLGGDAKTADGRARAKGNGEAGVAPIDPMQWWGALTQQFQEIATNTMKEVAEKTALETTRGQGGGAKAGGKGTAAGAKKAPSRKKGAAGTKAE